jgi:prophage regulatory protein
LIHPSAAVSTPHYDESNTPLAHLQLLVLSGFSSRQKQPAGGSAAMREPERIIRLRTVLSRTGLSRSTIYRKIAEGTFPPQIKISVNGSGWHESDINRWIADPVAWRPKHELDAAR